MHTCTDGGQFSLLVLFTFFFSFCRNKGANSRIELSTPNSSEKHAAVRGPLGRRGQGEGTLVALALPLVGCVCWSKPCLCSETQCPLL